MAQGESLLGVDLQRQLSVTLFENGLFGVKEHAKDYLTLKSKRLSPHYLDIRAGLSNYNTRSSIAEAMAVVVSRHVATTEIDVDYIVGSPEAMTSYAASTADILRMGLLQPRVALNKESGNKTPILGRFKPGEKVVALDDVVTDGDTKISTINSLREAGLSVEGYYVVLDREEGGAPQVVEATGLKITPALGVSSMVRILHAEGLINRAQYDNVARYLDEYGDPHAQETIHTALL